MAASNEGRPPGPPASDPRIVGLYDKDANIFHALPIGNHVLASKAVQGEEEGILLTTRNREDEFLLAASVSKDHQLHVRCLHGCCTVNDSSVPSGSASKPVKVKLGGSVSLGGSTFIFKEKRGPSPPQRRKERRLPSLPPEDVLSVEEEPSQSSPAEHEKSKKRFIKEINKDIRKLRKAATEPLSLQYPLSGAASSAVSAQVLQQPGNPLDSALHLALLEALRAVEGEGRGAGAGLLRRFLQEYRTALARPTTPTTADPLVVTFLFDLLKESTFTKELLGQMEKACCVLVCLLTVFSPAPANHVAMVTCRVYGQLTSCMRLPGLKDSPSFLGDCWTVLTDLVHASTPQTAMPLSRVVLATQLVRTQLVTADDVLTGKILNFLKALGALSRRIARSHSESDLRTESIYSVTDAAAILDHLTPLLPVLKGLPQCETGDLVFSRHYADLVSILAPVSPVPRKPPRHRPASPRLGKVRRLPKVPSQPEHGGVTQTPTDVTIGSSSPLVESRLKPAAWDHTPAGRSIETDTGSTERSSESFSVPNGNGTNSLQENGNGDSSGTPPPDPCTSNGGDCSRVEAPPTTGEPGRLSSSKSLPSRTEALPPATGVRGILANQIKAVNVQKKLLGQERGRFNLPPVRRDSPYYQTLTLKGSASVLAQLQKAREEDSSEDEGEEEGTVETAVEHSSEEPLSGGLPSEELTSEDPPPAPVRPGGDGRESCGSASCPGGGLGAGLARTHSWSPASTDSCRKSSSWSPFPTDQLFAFQEDRASELSSDHQALEELQAGHTDVMCTLQGRCQLIPDVCQLWLADKGLRALTNAMQMSLGQGEEDVALFLDALGVFRLYSGPWRLSVCAVLIPVLADILVQHNDLRYIRLSCEAVEMIVDRFAPLISSGQPSSRHAPRLSSSMELQNKDICASELRRLAGCVQTKLLEPSLLQGDLRERLSVLLTSLAPFAAAPPPT